jgi:hypothetical protein
VSFGWLTFATSSSVYSGVPGAVLLWLQMMKGKRSFVLFYGRCSRPPPRLVVALPQGSNFKNRVGIRSPVLTYVDVDIHYRGRRDLLASPHVTGAAHPGGFL